jgi:streptogramin lyase
MTASALALLGASSAAAELPATMASSEGSELSGALVVPSVDNLLGGQQARLARLARRSSPFAVAARAAARTRYEGDAADFEGVLAHAFPGLTSQPAGGAPRLSAGEHVLRYVTDHTAEVSLKGAKGVIESLEPIASRASGGRHLPLDLQLRRSGSQFAPARSDSGLKIPVQLSRGIRLDGRGVGLVPVDTHGRALAVSAGRPDGYTVLWNSRANGPEPDLATVAKALPEGFDLSTMLLSQRSPRKLYFRVEMPSGAHLLATPHAGARVKLGRSVLAAVSPVGAEDAEGNYVPTRMSVHGNTLVVSVDTSDDYLYPIDVDPEVNDGQLSKTASGKRSNWEFHTSNAGRFSSTSVYEGPGKERLETYGISEYAPAEWAYWGYQTKGVSKIYELKTETTAHNSGAKLESFLEFEEPGGAQETKKLLSTEVEGTAEYTNLVSVLCAANAAKHEECLPGAGKEHNAVHFQQSATASPGGNFRFSDTMTQGIVSIAEPTGTHSTTSFNTASPSFEFETEAEGKKVKVKRNNALYGGGSWLTKSLGAVEMVAKDPGIGVAATKLEYEGAGAKWEPLSEHRYLENENACQGVQCYETHGEYWTLDPKLPDGEDKLRYKAEEAISGTQSLTTEGLATVKVDTAAPHRIFLEGLPYGNELSERPYKLSAQATDGEGSTVSSSGIKSIALFVSGREVAEVGKQAGCKVAKGECTAKAEWSINGAELGAGHHAIVLVATDNAGNEARLQESISIRHSTPVSLGPGSLDLQSGDFTLSSGDVVLGSGLSVARNYSSRALNAGQEGPLGPQWSLNLGTTESLVEMVDGGLLLTDSHGKQVIFANTGGGVFEAPPGDANLKLTLEENKSTKQKLAYYLEDPAAHAKTKFSPAGGNSTLWVPSRQEGTAGTDTVSYGYRTVEQITEYPLPASSEPWSIANGPDGNLWFVDQGTGKIGKITPAGQVTEYPLPSGSWPDGIAEGADGNMWFIDATRFTIGKITMSGAITEYKLPEGTGNPYSIARGPDGNMWYTGSAGKIGKVTPSGAITPYALPAQTTPSRIVAGPDGNMWYTNSDCGISSPGRCSIGRISTTGVIAEYELSHLVPHGITVGPDGNLWFAGSYSSTNKIGKITTAGTITEYPLPNKGRVSEIAKGPDGRLWFTDSETNKVGKVTTSGAVTEYPLPTGSRPEAITAGPEGNMWFTDEGTNQISTMTTSGTVTEPTEVLAPVAPGVSCTTLKQGCRALKFSYSTATSAKGPGGSEWGEYKGRLAKVIFEAYDPTGKKMQETAVAEYSYDQLGRLRAEWDPRISPALKNTYGYDQEGHVTALDPPGQEPWTFTYGPDSSDTGTGRLLKAYREPTAEGLWNGEPIKNTVAPALSGTASVGVRLAVSNGTWSGGAASFGYQWEDCNTAGEGCTPILGASNPNYTPVAADVGHKLVAIVTATNGDGSLAAVSAASAAVGTVVSEYALPANSHPLGITLGPDGNVWFTDVSTGEAGKITSAGAITEYTTGKDEPMGIASGGGNLWFVEHSIRNVSHMTTAGALTVYTLSRTGTYNIGIAAGPDGDFWFTESETGYIGQITQSDVVAGEYALPAGSKPYGITKGPDGNLWFTDYGTSKIGKITTAGVITEYALPAGSKPFSIVAGPDGNLWFTDSGTSKVGKITTAGVITEYALPAGSRPYGIAKGSDSKLWFAENGTDKIGKITTAGVITEVALNSGSQPYSIVAGVEGNMWFTEYGTSKIGKLSPTPPTEGEAKPPQPGITLEYGISLSSSGLPSLTEAEAHKWGQSDDPVEGTAILPPDSPQGWPAAEYKRASAYYLDGQGRTVNLVTPSGAPYGAVSTTEYNEANDIIRTLTPDNRQAALEAGSSSVSVSKLLDTQSTYNGEGAKEGETSEPGTKLIETLGPQHEIKYVAGSEQKESLAREHTKLFYNEGAPSGETYDLVTKKTQLAQLANEEEVEVRKVVNSYSGQGNLGWKLRAPTSVTVDPEGKAITNTTLYNATTGQVTETRGAEGVGGSSARDSKVIYYGAEANSEGLPACGAHPEWAGLVCETLPTKQPEGGTPNLPVKAVLYNMYDEPTTTTETFGTTVRTKTNTYDAAGRLTGSEATATAGAALPKVTDTYSSSLGLLEKESTTVEGQTKAIVDKYNTLGQLTEYEDADGNIAKYKYGGLANDGQIEEISDSGDAGADKQSYAYNGTTKRLEKLTDSAAQTFTASYDADGRLLSEVYPNGMCANESYNSAGEATSIEYLKTTNCAEREAGSWFRETETPSIRGQAYARTNSLSSEVYGYDTADRLIEVRETPTGGGCHERIYAYDAEGDRTSQTNREPGGGGGCATEGGTTQSHTYDEAGRLTDSGIAYDSFGDVAKLPAADAEGNELNTTFYVDGAVATQSQSGVTNSYYLDPEGRVRETVTGGKQLISHYDGAGPTVAWTNDSAGHWTRDIPGIDGALAATQSNGETPILQLHDLQGDVVATIGDNSSETKLLSTYAGTEFGAPNGGEHPSKFAWLGAAGVETSLSSGVITYGATSYVPQTGRPLQSEAVEPPGLPEGSGVGNAYSMQEEPWNMQGAAREGAEAPGLEAARETAAIEAAINAAGEGHDPTQLLSLADARIKGEQFLKIGTAAEILNFIGSIPDSILDKVVGVIFDKFSVDIALDWYHKAGEKLVQCSHLYNQGFRRCRFSYQEVGFSVLGFSVNVVYFGAIAQVEKCAPPYLLLPNEQFYWRCERLEQPNFVMMKK